MKKLKIILITMLLLIMPLCVFAEEIVNELDKLSPNIKKGNNNSVVLTWEKDESCQEYQILRSTKKTSGFKKVATVSEDNYTDAKLTYGATYYYKVVGVSEEENITSEVKSAKVVPNKVENVKLKAGNKQITVTYNKTSNTGYEIYRSTDNKKWSRITTISRNKIVSYKNKRLSTNKTYYYKVRAYSKVRGKKIYGSFSDVVSTKTAPNNPTVSNIKAANYKEIDLTIKKVSGAAYYEVQRSTNKRKNFKTIGATETLLFNDEDINPTITYYYKVRACNENSICGSYSKVYSKKTSISKPTLKGSALSSEAILKWNNISYANGYELYYSKYKNKKYSKVTTTSELTANKTGLIPGKTYYFKIRSYVEIDSKKYYSSYSNIVTLKPSLKKVSIISFEPHLDSININYSYPFMDNNIKLQIQRSVSKKGKYTTIATIDYNNNLSNYVDSGLKKDSTYYYKVRAFVKVGKTTYYGSFSDIKSIKTLILSKEKADEIAELVYNELEYKDRIALNDILVELGYNNDEIDYASEIVDWKLKALNYTQDLITSPISKESIKEKLKERKFNYDEINYSISVIQSAEFKIDFKEFAYERAKELYLNFNQQELKNELVNEKYSEDEVEYALNKLGNLPFLEKVLNFTNRQEEGTITIYDEVTINSEPFYVIDVSENEITLLSKYNLDADNLVQSNQNPTKSQFSTGKYWKNNTNYIYDENSILYTKINAYANKIENAYSNDVSVYARLLSYEEAYKLDNKILKSVGNDTSHLYWLGTPANDDIVLSVNINGVIFQYSKCSDSNEIRPVIVISVPPYQNKGIKYISRKNDKMISSSDEISIGNEHFYVIESNENETKLLAKYNLNIKYNMQSKVNESSSAFSNTNYWKDEIGQKYDGLTPYVFDENSILYNIINEYANAISSINNMKVSARLLSYEETNIPIEILKSTNSYWLGSIYLNNSDLYSVYSVSSNGVRSNSNIYNNKLGIRPVIIVSTEELLTYID